MTRSTRLRIAIVRSGSGPDHSDLGSAPAENGAAQPLPFVLGPTRTMCAQKPRRGAQGLLLGVIRLEDAFGVAEGQFPAARVANRTCVRATKRVERHGRR